MGLLDALLGRSKVKGPAPDRLFAITTAAIFLETGPGSRPRGSAAIVFQPLATGDFAQIVTEMEEVVRGTGEETGTTLETSDDTYGYRWMVLHDDDIEDLAVGVNAVSDALAARRLRQPRALRGLRLRAGRRPPGLLHLQLQARHVVPVRARAAATSSAPPSASCRSRPSWAPSCRSSRSSSAGSPSGAFPI